MNSRATGPSLFAIIGASLLIGGAGTCAYLLLTDSAKRSRRRVVEEKPKPIETKGKRRVKNRADKPARTQKPKPIRDEVIDADFTIIEDTHDNDDQRPIRQLPQNPAPE